MKLALLAIICLTSVAVADGLVTEGNLHPREMHDVIYYDDSFCFVVGKYQDNLGLFVHSKSHKKWLHIKKISTIGGRFGRNVGGDPKLINASVLWDHTPLQTEAFAVLPLRTSGSICLPEKVAYDPETQIFELGFLTFWEEVPGAPTYLYIKRAELIEAFNQHK